VSLRDLLPEDAPSLTEGAPHPARGHSPSQTGGLPVVAVPVPLSPMPIGVQIIAAPWREDIALRIAYALEQAGVCLTPRPAM
jgi:Asp-tRNA(Asn)/Glu-tRNA(Gln) amidotransferase A subunit family amidase